LRFGGVRAIAGEATLCIDMAVAPGPILDRDFAATLSSLPSSA